MRSARPSLFAGTVLATWMAAGMAAAQDLAQRLDGLRSNCQPFVTIQYEGCRVQRVARCPDGNLLSWTKEADSQRLDLWTPDLDTLLSVSPGLENGLLSMIENRDPFSLRDLLANGRDDFDQTWEWRFLVPVPRPSVVQGATWLDGQDRVIDGRNLRLGRLEQRGEFGPGGVVMTTTSEVLVDEELGLLLRGTSEGVSMGASTGPYNGPPADFVFPGEPGFLTQDPAIGCGPILSKAPR